MTHIVSRRRFGFSLSALHRKKEPHPIKFLSQKGSFWIATLSVLAFLVGNMMGQTGWHLFWKSVIGKGSDELIAYVGTTAPIEKVPNYELWGALGGGHKEHTYRQVPDQVLMTLPDYNQREQLRTRDASTTASTYSVGYRGSYATGAENSGSHPGVDIRVPVGTPVLSIASGIVEAVKWDAGGFGHTVVIRHPNVPDPLNLTQTTTLYSGYAHLSAVLVSEGAVVQKGEQIALSGDSGNASGPHLHFQIDREEAPWHPYWPFTTREHLDQKMTFSKAVNEGLGSAKVLKYTVHPMLYVQADYKPIEKTVEVAEAKPEEEELSPLQKLLKRRADRLARRKARIKLREVVAVKKPEPIPVVASSSSVSSVAALADAFPVIRTEEVAGAQVTSVFPQSQRIARIDIQHDGEYSGRDWEKLHLTLHDPDGNVLMNPEFDQALYLRTAYGEADFRPLKLNARNFHQGRATVMMLPRGRRTVVIQVMPFGGMSQPMVYRRD